MTPNQAPTEKPMATRPGFLRSHRLSCGFNLLEVLIAILVLAIGLIGLAALQSVGLRSGHGAYLESQATLLAYDMSDRIRANPDNATEYVGTAVCPTDWSPPDPPLADAEMELDEWACTLEGLLPSASGEITNLGNDRFRIRVEWLDRQSEEDQDPWAVQVEVQL